MSRLFVCLALYACLCEAMHILDAVNDYEDPIQKQFDVVAYLEKYGYLPPNDGLSFKIYSGDTRKNAIRTYQKFANLKPTGEINEETIAKMRLPRCGNPDVVDNKQTYMFKSSTNGITTRPRKWLNKTITWTLQTHTDKLTREQQRSAIINAMQRWGNVSDIHFVETNGNADITVEFRSGDHGDGKANAFDGPRGVLAHAFLPKDGRTHFDNDENWVYHEKNGFEIEMIATHELGHALGLEHSTDGESIMAPFYQGYKENFRLNDIDVAAIQQLYGAPVIPSSIPTPRTGPTDSDKKIYERLCNSAIDAVTSGPNDMIHIFIGPVVYMFRLNCHADGSACIVQGFPKPIRQLFKKGPKRVHAAAFLPDHRQRTYLFKGRKVWRYKGYKLDDGYPQTYSKNKLPFKPSAAYIHKNQFADYQMYIFGRKYFLEIFLGTEDKATDELKTKVYWDHVPNNPDSFVQTRDGSIYMFKENWYNHFDHRRNIWEKRKLIGKDLLDVNCEMLYGQNIQN